MKSLHEHRARVARLVGFVLLSVFAASAAPATPIPFSPAQFAPAGERPLNMLVQDLNADDRPEQVVIFRNQLSDQTGAPAGVAGEASILSARPNPLRHGTTISYQLTESGPARLALYDASGRLVRLLVDRTEGAGPHQVTWGGRGDAGERLAAGRYILSLEGRAAGAIPLILLR